MFVENLLLPRFLILELVLVCHYFQYTKACNSIHLASVEALLSGEEKEGPCYIDNGNWTHQPLLISKQRSWLWAGEDGRICVAPGEEVTVSCPGSRSSCARSSTLSVACHHTAFQTTQTRTQVEVCGCTGEPVESEVRTGVACGPVTAAGELVQVGYSVESSFHPILHICHDAGTETTFFTNHTLHGAALRHKNIDGSRPAFKEGKLFFKGISANRSYKKRNQAIVLTGLLGDEEEGAGILASNYLARGHLTPDADFGAKSWQDSTYYYGNVAPQWQSINNGNWKRLEAGLRDKAELTAEQFQVVTGTLGVLELGGEEVWLARKGDHQLIPVPEYFFKLITDARGENSIAVVSSNNPALRRVTRSTILCQDICDEAGWDQLFHHRREVEEGVVFCCSPEEFSVLAPWAGPASLPNHALLLY